MKIIHIEVGDLLYISRENEDIATLNDLSGASLDTFLVVTAVHFINRKVSSVFGINELGENEIYYIGAADDVHIASINPVDAQ